MSRGADQQNAFALSFNGVESSNVVSDSLQIKGMDQAIAPKTGHSGELVYVLVDDVHQELTDTGIFGFYNTQVGDERSAVTLRFQLTFASAVSTSILGAAPYNPFIFSSLYRGRDIHLRNKPPTDRANTALLGIGDDYSNPADNRYYRTIDNLPWALDINGEWKHPLERVDILEAYPVMSTWVESAGSSNQNWYQIPVYGKCWKCNQVKTRSSSLRLLLRSPLCKCIRIMRPKHFKLTKSAVIYR